MRALKSGGLLLILAIPMALYVAWQVNGVVRTDLVLSDPPVDRGATKEQLAAQRAKAAAWAGEVRKAAAVVQQYRPAGAEDASPDPDASAVVKASAARAADLNDLDLFLSEIERPAFAGKLKGLYQQWTDERKDLKRDAEAVATWLAKPPAVGKAADATAAADALRALVQTYAGRSRFSDKAKAARWRVEGRLAVVNALTALADTQYQAAVRVKLPLEPGDNAVKTAVDAHRALKAQIAALTVDVKQAEEDKVTLDAATRTAAETKGAVADECAAREELLTVFARDDLFTNAAGAAPWLKQVAAQYRRTKDEKVRALIREKVQEFCDAFVPLTARLDDKVLIKGKEAPRKEVVVKYQVVIDGKDTVKREPLGELDGVNEFNLAAKRPGKNTFAVFSGAEEYPRDLTPTALSAAAVAYNAERKKVADVINAPRWTANSVEQLKKKCEAQKELVDLLQTPDGASTGKAPKIWTRLTGLAAGMAACADLFETAP